MNALFRDRRDAGRALAAMLLTESSVSSEPVVLALPRGGVPVAFEVANRFRAPLDVCIVQRLEVPGSAGVVMGAIASEQVLILLSSVIQELQVSEKDVTRAVRKQAREVSRRERAYRGERSAVSLVGRTVILVDDGLASLAAPITAIAAIRARLPERLVFATPVASTECFRGLQGLVDDLVCLELPVPFHSVGKWYGDFSNVSDLDVRRLHGDAVERARHWSFPN